MDDALTSAAVVWIVGAFAAVAVVLGSLDKVARAWGQVRGTWREHSAREDDADLAERDRIIENLRGDLAREQADHAATHERAALAVAREEANHEQTRRRYAAYRREWADREARWIAEKAVHRRWDHAAQEACPHLDPAPPLLTPDPCP